MVVDRRRQARRDLLARRHRERDAVKGDHLANPHLMQRRDVVGGNGQAPGVAAHRVAGQRDDERGAGSRRIDRAGGRRFQRHQCAGVEGLAAALGDIQGGAGVERREAAAGDRVDAARQGLADRSQRVGRAAGQHQGGAAGLDAGGADDHRVFDAVQVDDPAVAGLRRAHEIEGGGVGGALVGGHAARRQHRHRGGEGVDAVGKAQAGPVGGRPEVAQRRVGAGGQGRGEAGGNPGIVIASPGGVAQRTGGSTDDQFQYPFAADDDLVAEPDLDQLGRRGRRGDQVAAAASLDLHCEIGGEGSAIAIADDQQGAHSSGREARLRRAVDGRRDAGGNCGRSVDRDRKRGADRLRPGLREHQGPDLAIQRHTG